MPANPRHLILNLLVGAGGDPLSARNAVASSALFAISENRTRVALARLAGLGRSNRVALRARERALRMLGLGELERGLHLRPDNLVGGVHAIRERLVKLGLEKAAAVFVAKGFDPSRERRARTLWDGRALTRRYRAKSRHLGDWLARSGTLKPQVTARESFLLGNDAIRGLGFDPWLPAPLADVEARHVFVDAVVRFDTAGHAIWKRFLST
ncbi:MAG: PaaX family transcriptional regulator C-terminal domain-containing protein [Burkholderiales bacterium]